MKRIAVMLLLSTLLPGTPAAAEERPKIVSLRFAGNEIFGGERLEALVLSRPSGLFSRRTYRPELLDDDIETILRFYRREGFLEVAVTGRRVVADSAANAVSIEIDIHEGERTTVEGVTIFGNDVFPDSVLRGDLGLEAGGPFRSPRLREGSLAILSRYAEAGYLDAVARPDVRVDTTAHRAIVDIAVEEGPRATIDRIRIEGNRKTRRRTIERELLFAPGETARYSRLLESQRNLYLTGLFSSVFVRPLPRDSSAAPGRRDILVEVAENESIDLSLSIGYGAVDRARARIALSNDNLRGTGRKTGIAANASFVGRGVEGSFTEPRLFGTRLQADLTLSWDYTDEPNYDIERRGGRVVLGRRLGRSTTVSTTYRYEDSFLDDIEVSEPPGDLDPNIRSLTLSLVVDTRDNLFNATRGGYLDWSNELAGSIFGGSSSFGRVTVDVRRFHPLGARTVLGWGCFLGGITPVGDTSVIPIAERFFAGGPNSTRGFDYRMLGPIDRRGQAVGGRFAAVIRVAELRRHLWRWIGGVLFVEIFAEQDGGGEIDADGLRWSAGPGLRLRPPLGIVRGDLGVNLDPRDGENRFVFHLSVGQAF